MKTNYTDQQRVDLANQEYNDYEIGKPVEIDALLQDMNFKNRRLQ